LQKEVTGKGRTGGGWPCNFEKRHKRGDERGAETADPLHLTGHMEVQGSPCPGTLATFSGFQLLRNTWRLHAVSQLYKQGKKMAETEKVMY